MKSSHNIPLLIIVFLSAFGSSAQDANRFNSEKDLLLLHYDFKTDVDDLHSVAAIATLLANKKFSNLNYHAVAGTYGTQSGAYVPPEELCQLAFKNNWSDAHKDFDEAAGIVTSRATSILSSGGDVWVAEGGQSDFSAALVKAIKKSLPELNAKGRIHIIQHSDWNEEVTSKEALDYVKANTDYQKIPDGNAVGNGTPGFRADDAFDLKKILGDGYLLNIWRLAIDLANQYNGADNRYLNTSVAAGGLDFSDFSEVCWILNIEQLRNGTDFFNDYARNQ